MRIHFKKLLALIMSAVMLVGMIGVLIPAFAEGNVNITFETNGGQFKGDVNTECSAGDALPGINDISRGGLVFAGWYDNSKLTGAPIYTVPNGATGNVTYYAKWVSKNTLFDNFDDTTKVWADNTGVGLLSKNNNAENAYSGTGSMKYEISQTFGGYIFTSNTFTYNGDAIGFWLKTSKAIEVNIEINYNSASSGKICVPAGESFVVVPWTMFGSYLDGFEWDLWALQIVVTGANVGDVIYLDEVGSYSNCSAINFELYGGVFKDEAPFDYYPGMALPTYQDVTREGAAFAGWYNNAELSGTPIFTVPADAEGDLTYYAKWVTTEITGDNFESYTDTNTVTVDASGNLTVTTDMIENNNLNKCYYWTGDTTGSVQLNTNRSHAFSGYRSVKLFIPKKNDALADWQNATQFAIPNHSLDGDGAYFWIETDRTITLNIKFKYWSAIGPEYTLTAGKHLVAIPWSSVNGVMDGKQMLIEIKHGAEMATVYFDDFGTYDNIAIPDASNTMGLEFNLGGGSFVNYTAPATYVPKMQLPTYEKIQMDGYTFAGWYDNAGFVGLPVYYVPSDATGDITYYARWVECNPSYDNFESYKGKEAQDAVSFWTSWTYSGEISLNTDAAHAFSGSKSMKVKIKNRSVYGDDRADIVLNKELKREGNGIYFWINTEVATQVWLRFNYTQSTQGDSTAKVSIPAGNNLVMIPWSEIPEADARASWWLVEINVATPAVAGIENTVYIDDVGIFEDYIENDLTFDLGGGAFAEGFTAPLGFYSNAEYKLPTANSVVYDGFTFAGWYDNANFSGDAVTFIPAGTTGDKTYYAKWIVCDVNFDNFENGLNEWSNWGAGSSVLEITDAITYNGNGAMKYSISTNLTWDVSLYVKKNLPIVGDGLCFWIRTEQDSTIQLEFNRSTPSTGAILLDPITVTAGEHFITIPWSKLGSKITGQTSLSEMRIILGRTEGFVYYIDEIGTYTDDVSSAKDIAFITNGGKWSNGYNAPVKFVYGGNILPSYKNISLDGYNFVGWYDNAEFNGTSVKAVSVEEFSNKTYYAKWVAKETIFDSFENTSNKAWNDWTGNNKLTINTNPIYASSGTASMKYEVSVSWNEGYIFVQDVFPNNGDGIGFWVKSDTAFSLKVELNYQTIKGQTISVPAGENFVYIPWSEFSSGAEGGIWTFLITAYAPNGTVLYFDDIGTYTENKKYSVSFDIGDAQWVDSFTPDTEYSIEGLKLPTYENIKNKANPDMTLIGWCEKQNLSDAAVSVLPAGTQGDKVFYPKWAIHVADYDNFEDYKNSNALTTIWKGGSLNATGVNVHHGNKSLKLVVKKYASKNEVASIINSAITLTKSGEGICFWIEATQETSVALRLNFETTTKPGVMSDKKTVSAGKSLVCFSWAELGVNSINDLEIMLGVPASNTENTIYIDSIGTYHTSANLDITYNLVGGSFVNDDKVSNKVSPLNDIVLPTFENVVKEGFYFAGWYYNSEYTGAPVYMLAPGATGTTLYAKWVEQDDINHNFDGFVDSQAMYDAYWKDYTEAYEGWRESGGANPTLNNNTKNTAPNSLKSMRVDYTVLGGGYVEIGNETPGALFGNYNWVTTFGKRGFNKQGDGIRFWIKSDKTITMAVVFNKQGKRTPYYMPTITVPANVPILVYLPWEALSNNGYDAYELPFAGFEIFDSIGATGTVWIDDLGVYFDEKIVDYVRESKDGDIKITGYNNHIAKDTIAKITKHPISYLTELDGKAPEGATVNYVASYSLTSPAGGAAELAAPAWVSFKIPKGADLSKIGMYELFYDGSLIALNYTVEGKWITISTNNPMATIVMTTNDEYWSPRGPIIESPAKQPVRVETTITIPSEDENNQETNNNCSGGNRRPMREPISKPNNQSTINWMLIATIAGAAGVLVIGAIATIVVVRKRKAGGAK